MSSLTASGPTRGPRNTSHSELKRVGVSVIDDTYGFWLECDECHGKWSPNIPPRGQRFARGYWHCPHFGCNVPED